MQHTNKGNHCYLGMKLHTGADKNLGLIHPVAVTAVNAHVLRRAADLLQMSRSSTATLATRATPKRPRWKEQRWNSEWRCGLVSGERYPLHETGSCKIWLRQPKLTSSPRVSLRSKWSSRSSAFRKPGCAAWSRTVARSMCWQYWLICFLPVIG